MPRPQVLILRAPGTNCNQETGYAFQLAGAQVEQVHINRLIAAPLLSQGAQILCIPGGFSYGDDVAAGRILAGQIRHHLADTLTQFKEAGKLLLGICNGFQVLMQTGLLLEGNFGGQAVATLTGNDSDRYEDRWVYLGVDTQHCVFLRGVTQLYLPVAHAEGKFVARSRAVLDQLRRAGQFALRYRRPPWTESNGDVPYPENPNGSQDHVAGICDATGRVLGLMPHPERYIDRTQHPRWTREELPNVGDGLQLFRNAVDYFA